MARSLRSALLLAAFAVLPAGAGEISGLSPQLPPFLDRDLEVTFSNDFLGRGGSVDDFRTQQIILSAKVSDEWTASIDHSILTFSAEPDSGRNDQFSVSLGYSLINRAGDTRVDRLVVGTGIRSIGDLAGERMQNGFHRLIGSEIETLAYTGDTSNAITAWFDAHRYRALREAGDGGFLNGWRRGYWLRANSLATTGGQWDSSAAGFAVISKPTVDIWLGIRSDWRSGYDEAVLRETAAAEDDVGIVLGARFGPLVLETVQQLGNDASYGQLRLISSGINTPRPDGQRLRFGLEAGILLPDVQIRLAGRLPIRFLAAAGSRWRETIVVAAAYGEPQYPNDTSLFVRGWQIDAGLDFERLLSVKSDWLSAYGSIGAGWRDETLIDAGEPQDVPLSSVGRGVLVVGGGLRFSASGLAGHGRFRIQLGFTGRLPFDAVSLSIDGREVHLQRPALDAMLGMTIDFE